MTLLFFQALLVLLKKAPPKGKRLLVICTSSRREVSGNESNFYDFYDNLVQVLDQMEMLSAFTDVLHVANLSTGSHLMSILKQSDAFSKEDCAKLASKLSGRKASVGVKKLLGLIDMVKQTDPR